MHIIIDSYLAKHAAPNPRKWQYTKEIYLILHDSNSCWLCKRWLHHYITEVVYKDSNLKRAHDILNYVSTTQKAVNNVQQKRDKAFWDLAIIYKRLAYT